MENENTKVTVGLGYTLNLGNFQSLRIDVSVSDNKREGENTNDAFERVYKFVEEKLAEKVRESQDEAEAQHMADRKDRMALLSRYSKLHTVRYEQKPSLNLNVEQWAADALIESYGLPECYDLLHYYFDTATSPSWKWFANYADKIIDGKASVEQDLKERAERRLRAKEWLNE